MVCFIVRALEMVDEARTSREYLRGMRFLAFDIVADGIIIYDNGFYKNARETFDDVAKAHGITRLTHGRKMSKP